MMGNRIAMWVIGVVVVLLEIMLVPMIHIGYAYPNLILVYVVVCSVCFPFENNIPLAFLGGLAFDLISSSTMGTMTLTCVLISYACSAFIATNNNDTMFMPLLVVALALLISEFLYACLCIACGSDVAFAEALAYRVLPCWLYDTVLGLISFPLSALLFHREKKQNGVSVIN